MTIRRIGPRRISRTMTDPGAAAEGIYAALLAAQCVAGDVALCLALEKLAEGTGQNRFRHAAQILRGLTLGRKAIDDCEALRRIRAWPEDGRSNAVAIVAKDLAGSVANNKRRVEAIAQRLRRKLRKINE